MLQPKNNGWSYSKGTRVGAWHLLFDDDKNVIEFFESTSTTSTTINLFVGTREECEEFILGNGLVHMTNVEIINNVDYEQSSIFSADV